MFRSLTAVLLLLGVALSPVLARAASGSEGTATAGAVQPVVVEGFRSAHFGMSESEVRSAIKKDIGEDVTRVFNDGERTTVLSVTAKNLLPSAPPAAVSYILGATKTKLIQVNVVWGDNNGAEIKDVLALANTLVSYFGTLGGYAKDTVAVNQVLPDGRTLVFRGLDAKGHAIVLIFTPIREAAANPKDKPAEPKKAVLQLSYIEDTQKPDVFRIEKGQF